MKPLVNFQGRFDSGAQTLRFTWDARALGTDGYIVIAAIVGEGTAMQIDFSRYIVAEVRTLPGSGNMIPMKMIGGQTGVYKMTFCGFSVPTSKDFDDDEMLRICRNDSSVLISVMMGRAEIIWTANTSIQESVKLITIDITSNCDIAQDVLGYQYAYGKDLFVKLPFPGMIKQGKQCGYGPVLVPKDCEVAVVPYDAQFSGNLVIKQKKKIFGF